MDIAPDWWKELQATRKQGKQKSMPGNVALAAGNIAALPPCLGTIYVTIMRMATHLLHVSLEVTRLTLLQRNGQVT